MSLYSFPPTPPPPASPALARAIEAGRRCLVHGALRLPLRFPPPARRPAARPRRATRRATA